MPNSFNSKLSSQPVSLQERLVKPTELIFDENRAIKNTFVWYCIWFYLQKKRKIYSNKSPPLLIVIKRLTRGYINKQFIEDI